MEGEGEDCEAVELVTLTDTQESLLPADEDEAALLARPPAPSSTAPRWRSLGTACDCRPSSEQRRRRPWVCVLTAVVTFAFVVGILTARLGGGRPAGTLEGPHTASSYATAAVASDVGTCSNLGLSMLTANGSAVDAAVTTLLCLGVVNAFSSGLGGGGFMVVRGRAAPRGLAYDFREEAPAAAAEDMFGGNASLSLAGGLSIGVPGELHGLWTAHVAHGRLPWRDVVLPVAELAEKGFRVSSQLEAAIRRESGTLERYPALREHLMRNGRYLCEGDWVQRPTLARTLRTIADEGADAFYGDGSLGAELADEIQRAGGLVTVDDLRAYRTKVRPALQGWYKGYEILTAPPPASGPVLLSALNTLEGYSADAPPGLGYHRVVEAFKYAYAQRTQLADPDFADISEVVGDMLSKEAAAVRRANITDDETYEVDHYGPHFLVEETPGTTHVSILTADGEAVSVTSTINTYFGSKVLSASTGIIFNNEMDDFSVPNVTNFFGVPPSPANFIRPGKRPLSSSVPTIALYGEQSSGSEDAAEILVVGASGGTRITTSVAQVLLDVLTFNEGIGAAIQRRRLHHQLVPNRVELEHNFDAASAEALLERGHVVYESDAFAVVQGCVLHRNNQIQAASDSRKGGRPAGF